MPLTEEERHIVRRAQGQPLRTAKPTKKQSPPREAPYPSAASTEQLELMGTASMLTGTSMIAMVAFYLLPFLSLMMSVRKHFMPNG